MIKQRSKSARNKKMCNRNAPKWRFKHFFLDPKVTGKLCVDFSLEYYHLLTNLSDRDRQHCLRKWEVGQHVTRHISIKFKGAQQSYPLYHEWKNTAMVLGCLSFRSFNHDHNRSSNYCFGGSFKPLNFILIDFFSFHFFKDVLFLIPASIVSQSFVVNDKDLLIRFHFVLFLFLFHLWLNLLRTFTGMLQTLNYLKRLTIAVCL